jgi:hypothetical protein
LTAIFDSFIILCRIITTPILVFTIMSFSLSFKVATAIIEEMN